MMARAGGDGGAVVDGKVAADNAPDVNAEVKYAAGSGLFRLHFGRVVSPAGCRGRREAFSDSS